MFYEWTFTIEADTAQADAEKQQLPLHAGVIVAVEIFNPVGSRRYCRSQIWRMLNCLWPTNKNSYIATDGTPVRWQTHYELTDEPYELELRSWNIDDTYDHDVVVRINVLPQWVAAPYLILKGLVDALKRIIGLP